MKKITANRKLLLIGIIAGIVIQTISCVAEIEPVESVLDRARESYGNPGGRLYCDFGPITQSGGGCYSINDASECDTQYGTVSGSCANIQYCDFGPVTQWGGGCFEIDDAYNCDLEWGKLANFCN